jgi:hypothetical protein
MNQCPITAKCTTDALKPYCKYQKKKKKERKKRKKRNSTVERKKLQKEAHPIFAPPYIISPTSLTWQLYALANIP